MASKYTVGALMMLQRIQDHNANMQPPEDADPEYKKGVIQTRDKILASINKEIDDLKEKLNQ